MKKMLFLLFLTMPLYAKDPILPGRIVDKFVKEVEQQDLLPENVMGAMDNMISHTVHMLDEQGLRGEAQRIASEWAYEYRSRANAVWFHRSIPDHEPLIAWLDSVMKMVIDKLGRPFCVSSHICDIYSFNKTIKVAVNVISKKCDFSLPTPSSDRKNEHRMCMATDGVFSGLYSVTVYWIAMGSCWAAGGNFICGPIAMVAQGLCENIVCGPLADRIYRNRCESTPPPPQW